MEPVKVDELISILALAREDAKKRLIANLRAAPRKPEVRRPPSLGSLPLE